MKLLFTISLCVYTSFVFAQQCDCSSQLNFTINYYEKNNPAFQKIKSSVAAFKTYKTEVLKLKKDAKVQSSSELCIIQLDRYVGLLKDHHSEIGFNLKRIDLSTEEKITEFKKSTRYQSYKRVNIDTATLIPFLQTKKLDDIEGIYSNGGSVIFGIVPKENNPGQYIGVVLKQHKLLDVGHILLELTRLQKNNYSVSYNTGLLGFNFQKILKTQVVENGLMPSFGFFKSKPSTSEKSYEFKTLNDSTNYLRVSSFDGGLTTELNSFYNSIDQQIQSRPYLIVDIRNNSGGAERSFFNLLPYAYTRPLKLDSSLLWVSPENIKRYEEIGSPNYDRLIERMKAAKPFSFIRQTEDSMTTWSLDSGTVFPKKIALIFNKGAASAAEGLITYFNQSDKVITVGENSGGYIGYGNVMTAQTPCEMFTIRSTTTRYFEKSKYEFLGIEPMYKPSKNEDWVKYSQSLLYGKK